MKTKKQEARALAERAANERAARLGQPLPFPNMWDTLDPTKVPRDATEEEIYQSQVEFNKICRPRQRTRYTL